jgi:hypothetical protein
VEKMNYLNGTSISSNASFLYTDKVEKSKIYQGFGTAEPSALINILKNSEFMFPVFFKASVPSAIDPSVLQKSYDTDVFNDETIAAIEEAEYMLADPNTKKYNSFSDILAEVKAEVRDEIPD